MSEELRLGDIIVFKAGDDWMQKAIAKLTKSDVSHAAMVYDASSIVEMGDSGVVVSKIDAQPGETAYQLRLSPEYDPAALVRMADMYLNSNFRYDLPPIVRLAGLLLYYRVRPTKQFLDVGRVIFQTAGREADFLMMRAAEQRGKRDRRERPIACSQLAYQVYRDCSRNSEIQLKKSGLGGTGAMADGSGVRLIDLAKTPTQSWKTAGIWTGSAQDETHVDWNASTEELARHLYEAIAQEPEEGNQNEAFPPADASLLLELVGRFQRSLDRFKRHAEIRALTETMFVAPSDLVYHAENLSLVQMLEVKRV